ncbi:double-strand break repair protein AddB [Alkalilacustris brevis]|uniref:double-strand break repair protein AddB n=1 Tax=Alkalilacustris brevis TaxID=2026338 RepID=UPI000E0DCFAE|nr:double-strand break repair protein AddB [Alkalilacustris brevis]
MLFTASDTPRVFGLPPGVDFPRELAAGLIERGAAMPPEAFAQIEIYLNTRRMERRLATLLAESGARLLPRLRLITDPGRDLTLSGMPPAVSPLRRRLELMQLVARLLEREPGLAPEGAAYDLADSLARLMDEMQGEGVPPERLARLDVSAHSRHWQRSLDFVMLIERYFGAAAQAAPDAEARQRMAVEALAKRWTEAPPAHPVLIAGSTGSRGTTALLMEAVARLPQGALVLPGFDFDMPGAIWGGLDDALGAEDHPQYRFHALMRRLGVGPGEIEPWRGTASPPDAARNRLVSLALRPAPVTDQWMTEGRQLSGLEAACRDLSLVEAPSQRAEALAIALRLRKAAQDGQRAALVTPDRTLARQVTAALDRWRIVPDDSAGRPLGLSAPGRFLRHIAGVMGARLTSSALITLLKHPLTHSGGGRGEHLLLTGDLDLHLRRHGPPFPDGAMLTRWAARQKGDSAPAWADWLARICDQMAATPAQAAPLAAHLARHLALAEALAAGPAGTDSGELWEEEAGRIGRAALEELQREADHGGTMTARDYARFFESFLAGREVREIVQAHPHIMIRGTLEARVQEADLMILGGLNDGIWPQLPPPDPWLNRQMRHDAGLLLPERQIGLSAHDFQQAIAAPEVMLTRALRDAEAATVPSRWLNRLTNLLAGLPDQGGAAALEQAQARGQHWLKLAQQLEEEYTRQPPAPRPAPCPPVAHRPRQLSVTAIERLIRDPYAIYARHVLGLRPLDPLHPQPDAALRGQVLHRIVEEFIRTRPAAEEPRDAARSRLHDLTVRIMAEDVPWPTARHLWAARLDRVADWFLDREDTREGTPVLIEDRGALPLDGLDFTLTARPDRFDALPDGGLEIIDYKTGTPPGPREQTHFARQLLLEAAMARRGAFRALGPREVSRVLYIGLGATPHEVITEITPEIDTETWEGLHKLIQCYMRREQGYAARRAPKSVRHDGDYDHLARFGEWDMSTRPGPEPVGDGE